MTNQEDNDDIITYNVVSYTVHIYLFFQYILQYISPSKMLIKWELLPQFLQMTKSEALRSVFLDRSQMKSHNHGHFPLFLPSSFYSLHSTEQSQFQQIIWESVSQGIASNAWWLQRQDSCPQDSRRSLFLQLLCTGKET